jgi:hypothetical protein
LRYGCGMHFINGRCGPKYRRYPLARDRIGLSGPLRAATVCDAGTHRLGPNYHLSNHVGITAQHPELSARLCPESVNLITITDW